MRINLVQWVWSALCAGRFHVFTFASMWPRSICIMEPKANSWLGVCFHKIPIIAWLLQDVEAEYTFVPIVAHVWQPGNYPGCRPNDRQRYGVRQRPVHNSSSWFLAGSDCSFSSIWCKSPYNSPVQLFILKRKTGSHLWFKGELLQSCLSLLLASPMILLPHNELCAPIKLALELGLQHTDIACQAVSSLEAMEEQKDTIPASVLQAVIPLLSPYLLKHEQGRNETLPQKSKSESPVVRVLVVLCFSWSAPTILQLTSSRSANNLGLQICQKIHIIQWESGIGLMAQLYFIGVWVCTKKATALDRTTGWSCTGYILTAEC